MSSLTAGLVGLSVVSASRHPGGAAMAAIRASEMRTAGVPAWGSPSRAISAKAVVRNRAAAPPALI